MRFISDQLASSRSGDIHTDVCRLIRTPVNAIAVVDVVRESTIVHPAKLLLDDPPAIMAVDTEPKTVSRRAVPDTLEVGVGVIGIVLGCLCGGCKHVHIVRCAARIASSRALVADAEESEIAGELDPSNIPNSRVDVLGSSVDINVSEEVRRFDVIVSSTRSGEVVRCGHWW